MILSRLAIRPWPRAVAGLLAAVALLGACGGGSTQYDPFVAQRVFAFGDETSTITAAPAGNGLKYSVNGLDDDGDRDCRLEPLWVQSVASSYGFAYAECNPDAVEPRAFMFAAPDARAADVAAQVEAAQLQSGGFGERDLATVLAGMHDIVDVYRMRFPLDGSTPVGDESVLLAEAQVRGQRLAQAINRLVALGVKVVVSDLPDMGLTPFAAKEKALDATFDRAGFLSRLTTAFNERLGTSVLLDGRFIALVQADLQFRAINISPASFGLANIRDGVCTAELPGCTSATLLPGAIANQYLWADDLRISSGGHAQLGALAVDRARRNPF